ncbi:hypothetical protein AMS62_14075 [Bacillus sp. FJAT-18019]|nr:hypothetical protein AMS62_14075 [Bacillus sp. FJAT-18019]
MLHLNYGVKETSYYYTDLGNFLEVDNYKLEGSNIGYKGENLTITFLSLNRIELSIRLLNSIEKCLLDFKGEVLIIDNGSDISEINKLETFCKTLSYKNRLVKLGDNYGVAGGRNRTMEYVKTEWVMCLDNDIYFLNDPLERISQEISYLGCHFMNLPLLDPDHTRIFSLGGHLYVDSTNGEINVGGGSCYRQTNYTEFQGKLEKPFLSNFLFGGASILKKKSFMDLAGYDESMFIGFEDTDFSIRLFREGYKIGNSCVLSLVHDHPIPNQKSDLDYEKKRFAANTIKKSATHLEEKYNYKIWDSNLVKWLEKKNNDLGQDIEHGFSISEDQFVISSHKPKIALITDVDYWAFGNIARQIEKNLSNKYDISLVSFKDCDWDPVKLLFRTQDCDILHFFWRDMIPVVLNPESYVSYLSNTFQTPEVFLNEMLYGKILSTSVYDHLFLNKSEIKQRVALFNTFKYYVSSEKLNDIYMSIQEYPDPVMVIEDGVDEELFYPINMKRFTIRQRPLVIGWVGNSRWADGEVDYKGFRTIVKPVIDEMVEEGYEVKPLYCDRVDGFVAHEDMKLYYEKIDVLVCMSLVEGTPNPVLEAMACGVPIITTDVGIVPQVLGTKQKKFIVARTKEALKEKLVHLIRNRSELIELSDENILQISNWHWSKQCHKFEQYFDTILKSN